MRFLAGSGQSTALYEVSHYGVREVHLSIPGVVTDYARHSSSEAVIVSDESGDESVYLIAGGKPNRISSEPGKYADIAISTDGSSVAYTRQETASTSEKASVVVLYSNGTTKELGNGIQPQFLEYDSTPLLLFVTEDGVETFNLNTGEHMISPRNEDSQIIISRDGSRSLLQLGVGKFISAVHSSANAALPVGTTTLVIGDIAAYSGDNVVTASNTGGRAIFRYIPSASASGVQPFERRFTFKEPIYKIIP
jgi:hypothetical protein